MHKWGYWPLCVEISGCLLLLLLCFSPSCKPSKEINYKQSSKVDNLVNSILLIVTFPLYNSLGRENSMAWLFLVMLNGGLFPGKCRIYVLELLVAEHEKLYVVLFKLFHKSSSGTVFGVPCWVKFHDSKVILCWILFLSMVEYLLPQSYAVKFFYIIVFERLILATGDFAVLHYGTQKY